MVRACAGCGLAGVQGRASVGVWTATDRKIGFIGTKLVSFNARSLTSTRPREAGRG